VSYSEFLIPRHEYITFQTYFLSLLLNKKMSKILSIILISIFSLIIISCAKKDDSSSRSPSSTGADESSSGANVTSSCPGCIVLYIDKESLSKYKTDNYLLLDPFEGHRQNGFVNEDFEFYHESSSFG
jgi:hypothetical protein